MPKAKSASAKKAKASTIEYPRLNLNKSYIGLLYGVATVLVLFVVVFLGLRANVNRQGTVTDDAAKTSLQSDDQTTQNTYTTVKGDTLWSIAEVKYKSGYNWIDIAKANKISDPSTLEAGTKLVIPDVTPILIAQETQPTITPTIVVETPTPTLPASTLTTVQSQQAQPTQMPVANTAKIEGTTYTVKRDDNLWVIAERAYGDGYKWSEIAKANALVNPSIIHSGNELKLPR